MFLEELLVKVIRTPEVFALYVFSASVKFFDNTLWIGIIELNMGMKMPMERASTVAPHAGTNDGEKPRSLEKRIEYIAQRQGSERR